MHITFSIEITESTNFDDLAQLCADLKAIESGTTVERAPAAAKPPADDAKAKAAAKKKAEAAAKKKAEAAAKKKAEAEAAEAADLLDDSGGDDEQPSLDDVKAAVRDYIAANDIETMKKLLADEFGAAKLSEVAETDYAKLMGLIT